MSRLDPAFLALLPLHLSLPYPGNFDPRLRRSVIAFGGEVAPVSLSTTHFVAGDDLTAAERQNHQKKAPGARWVDADWLEKCIAAKRVLPIRL